jgi:hypothetical protein
MLKMLVGVIENPGAVGLVDEIDAHGGFLPALRRF